jgi:hypothetical protein
LTHYGFRHLAFVSLVPWWCNRRLSHGWVLAFVFLVPWWCNRRLSHGWVIANGALLYAVNRQVWSDLH